MNNFPASYILVGSGNDQLGECPSFYLRHELLDLTLLVFTATLCLVEQPLNFLVLTPLIDDSASVEVFPSWEKMKFLQDFCKMSCKILQENALFWSCNTRSCKNRFILTSLIQDFICKNSLELSIFLLHKIYQIFL